MFHWLVGYYNKKWTSFNLRGLRMGGQTVGNLLYLRANIISSKASQYRESCARKAKVHPSFQITSTFECVWLELNNGKINITGLSGRI